MDTIEDHQTPWQPTSTVLLVTFVAIGIAILKRALRSSHDPREPPVLQPRIPFIGHIIGLATDGAKYWKTVSARCPHPIFTLPMLSSRTYVVTSPNLASQVQRASKTLQFNPLIVEMTNRMLKFDDHTMKVLRENGSTNGGQLGFMDSLHEMTYTVLSPEGIKEISDIVLQQLSERINSVTEPIEIDLFLWVRKQFTIATTYTFYGPENPFVIDPSLEQPFWDFEAGVIGLLAGIFPSITARKAYLGREKCAKAFIEYMQKERYKRASKLIQERVRLHSAVNFSLIDCARSEVGMLFGALVNAGVTTFWVLNNIFSRPTLLAEIRDEIEKNAMPVPPINNNMNNTNIRTISFSALKSNCPLINSVFRESLRLCAPMSSSRIITEDTMIADTYLLRANSVVQVAGGVIQADPSVWGPDVAEFNARRFLSSQSGIRSDVSEQEKAANGGVTKKQVHPAAFRAFGGGSVFCPGRHFAQVEVLSFVAGVVMAFDLVPTEGASGIRFDPPKDEKRVPIGVMKPLDEVRARMRKRSGLENVKWVLKA
ncbi:cytochrome P450 [Lepidopterella palustris CBS 459.81]|uniref:Cytochrome P450 n=1 Tax=Lepidopterella palustris CBS 459.81 TaxID=1314670 RepID=A0A8E2E970_9PEZI|nr:cytochrome P450 [Lepidopterella palustris CBS 459.81]